MRKIVFASNNKNKLREVCEILLGFEILSLNDIDLNIEIEENGNSFEENSFIKAKAVFERCNIPAIADDSGLMVEALNGDPGIYSARYSGKDATDESNNALLLRNLEGIEDRRAEFVSVITYYDGTNKISTVGKTCGSILEKPLGSGGFGYDPLFYSDELKKSFGEATEEEKNSVSHRSKALKAMAQILEEKY